MLRNSAVDLTGCYLQSSLLSLFRKIRGSFAKLATLAQPNPPCDKEFLQNKRICVDFNFQSIDPKFLQIVANSMAYNQKNFQID
jgi:hypothetical protein